MNEADIMAHRAIWGPYPNYDDIAKFQYGRILWRDLGMRNRLLDHWTDDRHPSRERFREHRQLVEATLASDLTEAELQNHLLAQGTSLRCVAREIPSVFGSFFS